jgi:hypothetical protein
VWKGSIALSIAFAALCASVMGGATWATAAYVDFYNGEYLLSTPATKDRPPDRLPPEEGKAILERLLNPAHMVVTNLGEAGNATLRMGDSTKAELFSVLGPAKRLPDWRRCAHDFGYTSARPGDSTVVVVRMDNPCLGNEDYTSGFIVCFSPSMLPKDYRPYLKRFVPSAGIHAGLTTQSGLKLGMTPAEVEVMLGKPLWKEKNAYSYGALGEVSFPPEFLITRWHWPKNVESKLGGDERIITVWFVGGRVSCFEVRKLYDL